MTRDERLAAAQKALKDAYVERFQKPTSPGIDFLITLSASRIVDGEWFEWTITSDGKEVLSFR